jgi:hypothetical protein
VDRQRYGEQNVSTAIDQLRRATTSAAEHLPLSRRRPAPEHVLLILVSAGYALLVLFRTSQSMALTYDEVVYASQVSADTPATIFTAHRSRGMSLLLAPVVSISEWVFVFRLYLIVLSGLFMYLAFRPWLAVFGGLGGRYRFVPAAAAAGLTTLWLTVLYGTLAYPNLWVGFAVVAGVGYFCQAVSEPGWRPLVGLGVAFAAGSLIRPTDALVAAVPLLAAPLLVRAWRRWRPWLVVVAGLSVGWGAWIAEGFVRFDGPAERWRSSSASTGSGLADSLPANLDALDGPRLLCRPHSVCEGIEPIAAAWWFALPVLVAVGLVAAARSGWLRYGLLATASAVAVAGPYLFYIGYAAPRFLLPSYGLLAIPVAGGLLWLTGLGGPKVRALTSAAVVGALLAHLLVQQDVLETAKERPEEISSAQLATSDLLREQEGVRPPCLFWGSNAIQLSYQLKCRSELGDRDEAPAPDDPAVQGALDRGDRVVVQIDDDVEIPEFMAGWRRVELPSGGVVAYLSPSDR